jgi:hypothetical protein
MSGFRTILPLFCSQTEVDEYRVRGCPIINGTPDTSVAHMAVVALYCTSWSCSGTLIAPRVVLTAAHCVEDLEADAFLVLFGNNVSGAITRTVSETWVHPGYRPISAEDPPVNDMAMLLLSEGAPPGVEPIAHLPHSLGITQADIGRPLEFVGFGVTETGQSGRKMTVTNDLSYVCTQPGGCLIGGVYRAAENTICQDQDPGGPCSGDSGGPAFVMRGGEEYVAGIASYGTQDCHFFGCGTKVDENEALIDEFVQGRLGSVCQQDQDCRSGSCARGVCCDTPCSGPCEACDLPGFVGSCLTLEDHTPCPDADLCNGTEVCLGGACCPGEALQCDDGDPCTQNICDSQTGCIFPAKADGTSCDNGNLCDGLETCVRGYCREGDPPDCDDGSPCTDDICVPSTGCQHDRLPDGEDCGKGPCGPSSCNDGICELLDPDYCVDANLCTWDQCDLQKGCIHGPVPDGRGCGACKVCQDGRCVVDPECAEDGCHCGGGRTGEIGWLGLLAFLGWRRRLYAARSIC